MESGYRKAVLRLEKPTVSSTSTTPIVSRTSSVNSSPSPDPTLGKISVALSLLGVYSGKRSEEDELQIIEGQEKLLADFHLHFCIYTFLLVL